MTAGWRTQKEFGSAWLHFTRCTLVPSCNTAKRQRSKLCRQSGPAMRFLYGSRDDLDVAAYFARKRGDLSPVPQEWQIITPWFWQHFPVPSQPLSTARSAACLKLQPIPQPHWACVPGRVLTRSAKQQPPGGTWLGGVDPSTLPHSAVSWRSLLAQWPCAVATTRSRLAQWQGPRTTPVVGA